MLVDELLSVVRCMRSMIVIYKECFGSIKLLLDLAKKFYKVFFVGRLPNVVNWLGHAITYSAKQCTFTDSFRIELDNYFL